MEFNMLLKPFEMSLVFSVFGLVLFALAIWIIVKVCPFSVRKEIEDDQNIALAVIIGAIILGIALIVAAAIHGSPDAAAPAGAKATVGWPGQKPSLQSSRHTPCAVTGYMLGLILERTPADGTRSVPATRVGAFPRGQSHFAGAKLGQSPAANMPS
ncbi:MAG: DUF350 domain-containing protein [Planctomycetes bacterium]|nr:DUF350 domain-containing protein [Planctomycetota bacterium]